MNNLRNNISNNKSKLKVNVIVGHHTIFKEKLGIYFIFNIQKIQTVRLEDLESHPRTLTNFTNTLPLIMKKYNEFYEIFQSFSIRN